jgi:hypothetical protein
MVSTTPPPPKTGGSGGFIAAAVVMLLLMGGLIYWKLRGTEEPPQAAPTPPPPSATHATLEEPPPPPPPPVVEEDAGSKTTRNVIKGKGGNTGGGCGGECSGPSPQLQAALRGKAGQSRGCYERALRQNNLLQGRLVVGVRIGPQGQVCSAGIVQNSLGDPGVASCVVQMFRAGSFPATGSGCAEANVPMNFVPKT